MTVQDDLRRLSRLDSIYLGSKALNSMGPPVWSWYKGRIQQANDGNWIFRSISQDGSVIGFQLGPLNPNWGSYETSAVGISVEIPIALQQTPPPAMANVALVNLQQQLP